MKRMYGDFEMSSGYGSPTREPSHRTRRRRKSREATKHDIPDGGPSFRDELDPEMEADGDSFFANIRKTRNPRQSPGKNRNDSGRYFLRELEFIGPLKIANDKIPLFHKIIIRIDFFLLLSMQYFTYRKFHFFSGQNLSVYPTCISKK